MDVIRLRLLVEISSGISTVDHAGMHRDAVLEHILEETRTLRMPQSVDATL